jgi:hypothetical protein
MAPNKTFRPALALQIEAEPSLARPWLQLLSNLSIAPPGSTPERSVKCLLIVRKGSIQHAREVMRARHRNGGLVGYRSAVEANMGAYRRSLMPIGAWLRRERIRRSKAIGRCRGPLRSLMGPMAASRSRANFRLGEGTLARSYVRQAGEIDLAKNTGHAADGVHMAALGGLWHASSVSRG